MKQKYLTLLWIVLYAFVCNSLNAQKIDGTIVSIENKPIADVSIFIDFKKVASTNALGIFQLPDNVVLPINLRLEHPDFFLKEVVMTREKTTFQLNPFKKNEELDAIFISSKNPLNARKNENILFPISVISTATYDAYSPMDLVWAINETPGVLIQSGAINTNRITIRGVGSRTLYGTNKIRSYFNGIPITNGVGETAIDIFDPENLQSVEIIKGPKAPQYGSNLGGTLLLTTKLARPGETLFNVSATVGSFGFIKNKISFNTASDEFVLGISYDFMRTDGFREHCNYDRNTLLLNSKYKLSSKNELFFLINYSDYFAQIPSSIGLTAFNENPSQAAFTWKESQGYENSRQVLGGIGLTHQFSKKFSNTTTVFLSSMDNYEPRPFNILDETTTGYGARTVFSTVIPHKYENINFSFGTEIYHDTYNWMTIENRYEENNGNGSLPGSTLSKNFEVRNNLNVFATVTIPFTQKMDAQFGLNFHKTHYSFTDEFNTGADNTSADRNFEPFFAPNINLLYKFTDNLNAFLNFSGGFNYPSIEETLTPKGVINPELGPETGFNYEVGSSILLLDKKIQLQVNAYLLEIKDLLVSERIGDDEYIGRNAGKTEHKGIEMQASLHLPLRDWGYFSPYLNAEFSNHKFVTFIDEDEDFSGNQLTGVPDNKISGGFTLSIKQLIFNTNFIHVGEMPLNDANTLYSNDYSVLNAKVSYNFIFSKWLSMSVNTGINNITDEKYAASVLINASSFGNSEPRYYYPGMPINWYSGIKLSYTIL